MSARSGTSPNAPGSASSSSAITCRPIRTRSPRRTGPNGPGWASPGPPPRAATACAERSHVRRAKARLGGQGQLSEVGQRLTEFFPGADAELGEDLVQVPLDRPSADEQPDADLCVGVPVAGEPGDLGLLCGQLAGRLDGALADGLPGGQQLAPGALREPLETHLGQHLVGHAELLARVDAAVLTAQP